MRGYRGSPAEREDRDAGIKQGGKAWLRGDPPVLATIDRVEVDGDGDPVFHLSFAGGREPARARRDEINAESEEDLAWQRKP
jgi:hypothetical protein